MEKNYLSALEDTNNSITKKITSIHKYLAQYSSADSNNKQLLLSKINNEFNGVKTDLRLIKADMMNLEQSENKNIWTEKYSNLKMQKEKLENEINKLKSTAKIDESEDYMNIDKKVDLGKLSSEQVMKRGDKILKEDEKSLQNMIKTLSKGREMMQETNKELYKQMESMDRIDGELNEMDGSLNRAKKTIGYMNKIA